MSNQILRALAAGAMAAAASGAALADAGGGWDHHGMGFGGWLLGPFMMILFVGLVVVAVVATAKALGFAPEGRSTSRARNILDDRFASGEIDKAEYEERRKALGV